MAISFQDLHKSQPSYVFSASSLAASGQGPEAAMACQQRADNLAVLFWSSSNVLANMLHMDTQNIGITDSWPLE